MEDLWGEQKKPDLKQQSEFGGVPGLFGNVDMGAPLEPHQERTAGHLTDPADEASMPRYGTFGVPTS